jgi:hypothetical protein
MSDKKEPPVLLHSALHGLLIGILVPSITIATIGLEKPLWELLAFGAILGTASGLTFRLILRL